MTGTFRPASLSLICLQTSKPLTLDSMAESSTTSGFSAKNASSAAFPSRTVTTSKPSSANSFLRCCSSRVL